LCTNFRRTLWYFRLSASTLKSIRNPEGVTTLFLEHAGAHGFPGVRLHDIEAGHATALLDGNVPVHVAAARCGHDPARFSAGTPAERRSPTPTPRELSAASWEVFLGDKAS
jgi:hypothetical protein